MHTRQWLTSVLFLAALATGCASTSVTGGKLVGDDYLIGSAKATYAVAEPCSDGTRPEAAYVVGTEQGKPALLEFNGKKDRGTLITNQWTAPDGDHYFGSVHHAGPHKGDGFIAGLFRSDYDTAWEYVIPAEGPGKRLTYKDCKMATGTDGVTKPTSQPSITCVLALAK